MGIGPILTQPDAISNGPIDIICKIAGSPPLYSSSQRRELQRHIYVSIYVLWDWQHLVNRL